MYSPNNLLIGSAISFLLSNTDVSAPTPLPAFLYSDSNSERYSSNRLSPSPLAKDCFFSSVSYLAYLSESSNAISFKTFCWNTVTASAHFHYQILKQLNFLF